MLAIAGRGLKFQLPSRSVLLVLLSVASFYFFYTHINLPSRLISVASPCYPSALQRQPKLLFGVFVTAEDVGRRNKLREAYAAWKPFMNPNELADFVYVMCQSPESAVRAILEVEQRKYGDLLIVPGEENVDSGKTWQFFKSIVEPAQVENYDYIFKLDSDAFVNLPALFEDLREIQTEADSELVYWGAHLKQKPTDLFHYGSLYGISLPLLQLLADPNYAYPSEHTTGPEDHRFGQWISNLPPEVFQKVKHVNKEGRFVDSLFSKFEKQDWTRPVEMWAQPAMNTSHPTCGTEADLRKEALVVHQLKEDAHLDRVVDWWIKGSPITAT